MGSLFLATLGFVAGHFLLSAPPLRGRLAAALGGEAVLASGRGAVGIFTVTRHPFL